MYVLTLRVRKRDNNCRYGYVNESAQTIRGWLLLVIRAKVSPPRSPCANLITLSAPSLAFDIISSRPGKRNNERSRVSFCGREKSARLMLTINQSPVGASRSAVHFVDRERVDRIERERQRERERTNSISRPCLPFRYVPLYNVTYSTVATLRLIKSVLTRSLDPWCGSVERAPGLFTVSRFALNFRTRITAETDRAYAISYV